MKTTVVARSVDVPLCCRTVGHLIELVPDAVYGDEWAEVPLERCRFHRIMGRTVSRPTVVRVQGFRVRVKKVAVYDENGEYVKTVRLPRSLEYFVHVHSVEDVYAWPLGDTPPHPHAFEGGRLCLGATGAVPGDILARLDLAKGWATAYLSQVNYNSLAVEKAARELADWLGFYCNECDQPTFSPGVACGCYRQCYICDTQVHIDEAVSCNVCGNVVCSRHFAICEACDDSYCTRCADRHLYLCGGCDRWVCCLAWQECPDCCNLFCESCVGADMGTSCTECKMWFCGSCLQDECAWCGSPVCSSCASDRTCCDGACTNVVCDSCYRSESRRCDGCDTAVCSECVEESQGETLLCPGCSGFLEVKEDEVEDRAVREA